MSLLFNSPRSNATSPPQNDMSKGLVGVRNDLKEIGGSLKSGFDKLSNFLSFKQNVVVQKQEECDDVAGISEQTVKFVEEICKKPEFWTHFPLLLPQEFRMSDGQREHVLSMEWLVPSLGDVRSEVGEYVGEEQFWMVYFVLLAPRLTEFDAHILSTPQIVETRNLLLQKLKNKSKMRAESAETSNTLDASLEDTKVTGMHKAKISAVEEKVTQIVNSMNRLELDDDENAGLWFEGSDVSIATSMGNPRKHESEEDGSFSDLEDDLSSRSSVSIQRAQGIRAPSPSGSSDWVQLSETAFGPQKKPRQLLSRDKDSDVESSDWLKVGDSD